MKHREVWSLSPAALDSCAAGGRDRPRESVRRWRILGVDPTRNGEGDRTFKADAALCMAKSEGCNTFRFRDFRLWAEVDNAR